MLTRRQRRANKTLKPVPEIPAAVRSHISYVANRMIGKANFVDADLCDLIQILSLEVLNALPKFRPSADCPTGTAFLNRVVDQRARNIYRDRIAAGLDNPTVPIDDIVADSENGGILSECAQAAYDRNRRLEDIRELVAQMPEDLRNICELLQEGLPLNEIARRVGIAATTLRTRKLPKIKKIFVDAEIFF